MKRVIHIPVVHTLADLGSLGESVRAGYLQRYGAAGWGERQRAVGKFSGDVRRAVEALPLAWPSARIYQDGLPVCGKEEQIVRELAAAGSANHQLVLELVGRGASLVGTEDPELLLREYHLQRRRMESSGARAGRRQRFAKRPISWPRATISSPAASTRRLARAKRDCCFSARPIGSTRFAHWASSSNGYLKAELLR